MRGILFRGKRIDNGEWIEGLLCENINGKMSIQKRMKTILNGFAVSVTCFEVDLETVGQFTELSDKNNGKIFEGSILKIKLPLGGFWGDVEKQKIGVVRYEPERGSYIVEWEYSKNQHHVILDCDIACESEILGSIHDNPELLTP